MITGPQIKAARALLNMDRKTLSELANLSVPTIQRMEAAPDVVNGNVESMMKVIEALQVAGVELINENAPSLFKGRGVRLKGQDTPAGEILIPT
jgi:transcriptional regulator with XRE-family HTH domain